MDNLSNRAHPPWCRRGDDCLTSPGWHSSRIVPADPLSDSVVQVGAGLWRLDVSPDDAVDGILVELALGADIERWPVDLTQARTLVPLLTSLLRQVDPRSTGHGQAA